MAYILDGQVIRRPNNGGEASVTQYAQHRSLNNRVGRDYFGDNKRVWKYNFINVKKVDYDVIKAIYNSYLSTNQAQTWEITETNYTVTQTDVHLDLVDRDFKVQGSDYLSDFTLTLTEV